MRSRTLLLLPLAFACDTAAKPELLCTGSSLREPQGESLNGIWDNGIWGNGIQLQGDSLQGVQLQGSNLNGIHFQGQERQGTNLNGESLNRVSLSGSTLVGADKRALELAGATIDGITISGKRVPLTITAIEHDASTDITYYSLAREGRNICGDGGKGMFVAGAWDASGHWSESLGSVDATYSCTTGVIAKCARWGYQPWIVGHVLHETCTRMARADYCGDGVPHTVDGTLIDLYDVEGIQVPEHAIDATFQFEAGWGPNGAVCVNKPRYADKIPSCWSQKPACGGFDDAIAQGALMGNASGVSRSALSCE